MPSGFPLTVINTLTNPPFDNTGGAAALAVSFADIYDNQPASAAGSGRVSMM
jgi:hypothetical protein